MHLSNKLLSKASEALSGNRSPRRLLTLVAVLVLLVAGQSAYASCGSMLGMKAGEVTLPSLSSALPHADLEEASPDGSIVGLWHVVYTADGGAPFGVSLKEWHSDGTEFENIAHSPTVGNVCFGVWKQIAARTFKLHHLGWLFSDTGVLTGTFTINEVDTVSSNGLAYKGEFTFKTYDLTGAFTGVEVKGSIASTRITVE